MFDCYYYCYIVGRESNSRIFDFHIFQERQKTEKLLLGVSYIAESQTGLYLVTVTSNEYFMVIMKSFTWVTTFLAYFCGKPRHFEHLFHGKSSYLGKMITKIMVSFIDTIYIGAWLMLFKGVLIGIELREFDRMWAMRLVFPRWQKVILVKIRVTRFWLPNDDMSTKYWYKFAKNSMALYLWWLIYCLHVVGCFHQCFCSYNSCSCQTLPCSVFGLFAGKVQNLKPATCATLHRLHILCILRSCIEDLTWVLIFYWIY